MATTFSFLAAALQPPSERPLTPLQIEAKHKALIEHHEGRRKSMYQCTAGKNTIGVGHNLDANPISDAAINQILDDDYRATLKTLNSNIPFAGGLDWVRQAALVDLVFNMGIGTLLTFTHTLDALEKLDFEAAADGLKDSKWFHQVGMRGPRIVAMIRTGQWPAEVV